jgi:ribonuclease PH
VYGPVAAQNVNQTQIGCTVSIVIKYGNNNSSSNTSSNSFHEYGQFLQQILTGCIDTMQFARCIIQITLQIVQSDGSLLGNLLHSAIAALMDAGVDLLYLPVATTCLVSSQGIIVLDPTQSEEEEDKDTSIIVLVTDPRNGNQKHDTVLGTYTVGPGTSLDQLLPCIQIATKASTAITTFLRLAIEQKVTRESKTLWSR